MTDEPTTGRRQRALMALARFVCRRALLIVVLGLLAALASVVYTGLKLEFITERNALVAPDAEYNKRFLEFVNNFGDQELMLLMVAPAPGPVDNPDYNPPIPDQLTRDEMKQAAAAVVKKLREKPEFFPVVIDRVDPAGFGATRMLYLPQADLESIATQVEAGRPLIHQLAETPSYPGMLLGMRRGIEEGSMDNVPDDAALARAGDEMAKLLAAMHRNLAAPSGEPPMKDLFAFDSSDPGLDKDGWFLMWEGRLLFVAIRPTKDQGALNQIEQPLAYAREVVAEVQAQHPKLAIGLTGRPVIYSDEMAASGRDMTIATLFAIFAVGLMFVLAFRSFSRPLLAVVSLVLALCWTIGATTLLIGHLNIFAMVFGVVLVGLGIDFGIHLLAHYRHGLERGLGVREALIEVYREIGMGTVLGAVTTAAALSTAALTDFLGLAELGLICGIGIMLCLVAMLLVFPAMLVVLDARRVGDGDPALRATMAEREAAELAAPHPGTGRWRRVGALAVALLMVASLAITGIEIARGWIPFDYNLLELNDPGSEGVHWEKLLIDHDQRASYAVSTSRSLEELRALRRQYDKLAEQGIVRGTESILPENELAKRETLARIDAALPAGFSDVGLASDSKELRSAVRKLQAALRELQTRGPRYEQAFEPALVQLQNISNLCQQRGPAVDTRLAEVEPEFFANLVGLMRSLKRDANPPAISAEGLPPILRSRYVGKNAEGETLYALYVYPAKNVWERELAAEFNEALLAVDPQATGVTIQIQESGSLIVEGFGHSVLYAFIAIVVLLALDLRRPLALLVAMLPLVCSLAILLGVMTLTDLSFNFANFFAVPILIGTTVDAGVYLVHSQRHGDARRTVAQSRHACLLCGLTTLLGFGSLVIASHLGIVSLGLVLTVGCLAGILGSYFLVPAVLGWFNERGRRL
ncbi:MAG: MMPL family transporter [Planctomycetota bacterium]|nr:MMPL family transporter [Planctomycetota bacterium]